MMKRNINILIFKYKDILKMNIYIYIYIYNI